MGAGCWSSWHGEWMQVGTTHHDAVYQTVHHEATYQTTHHEAETTIVHHDATGHNEQAVDQAAWDESSNYWLYMFWLWSSKRKVNINK